MEGEEGFLEEQNMEIRGGNNNNRLMLPDDGYEWRKYGQKFIKNIAKFRNYFRCRKRRCGAKKRVEWSTLEPDNLQVVYDGVHSHAPFNFSQRTTYSHTAAAGANP
ncbi:probable WRKY transcription factor 43 [Cornus florida]|uniref:probable WRKY transcription factor 43 n=1 Tax=Cornus florida TaxID=4283 RepID=UPI00289A9B35|nr:probable WRKY transcription factor 43 [Cornus florida]